VTGPIVPSWEGPPLIEFRCGHPHAQGRRPIVGIVRDGSDVQRGSIEVRSYVMEPSSWDLEHKEIIGHPVRRTTTGVGRAMSEHAIDLSRVTFECADHPRLANPTAAAVVAEIAKARKGRTRVMLLR
jgi:hypothetical protein